MKLALLFTLIVLGVIFGPLALIWTLNTLFPALAIPYALETWVAVILLKSFLTIQID